MHVTTIDAGQLADLLRFAKPKKTIDHDGQLIHMLLYRGGDLLAIVNPITGGAACIAAACIYTYESLDAPTLEEEIDAILADDDLDAMLADLADA